MFLTDRIVDKQEQCLLGYGNRKTPRENEQANAIEFNSHL